MCPILERLASLASSCSPTSVHTQTHFDNCSLVSFLTFLGKRFFVFSETSENQFVERRAAAAHDSGPSSSKPFPGNERSGAQVQEGGGAVTPG